MKPVPSHKMFLLGVINLIKFYSMFKSFFIAEILLVSYLTVIPLLLHS